jgi:hypothetical protein
MKTTARHLIILALLAHASAAWASDAETSATAGSRTGQSGTAEATARYEGDEGFARTQARSGLVSLARGVAVGVDGDGLSFSVSHAIDTPWGPALARNFSLSIGRDGKVSISRGGVVSDGQIERSASAGGWASSARHDSQAGSFASGRTDPFGKVQARVESQSYNSYREYRLRRTQEMRRR